MSEQIDWSKAPEGATHHKAEDSSVFELWLKPGYAVRVSRGSPDWVRSDCADKLIADGATARPTTPSWSGEGIPPVGVVCEVRQKTPHSSAFDWEKCTICLTNIGANGCVQVCTIDHRGDFAIYYPEIDIVEFRPIRTPEQIESAARIEAAQEWLKSIGLEYGEDAADQCESILVAAEAKRMAKL